MSLTGKTFLFYSTDPRDKLSKYTINLISQNKELEKMFYFYNLSNPRNYIPKIIQEIGQVPVIIANGFNKPIIGAYALEWVKTRINSIQGADVIAEDGVSLTAIDINQMNGGGAIYEDFTVEQSREGKPYDSIGVDNGMHDYSEIETDFQINTHDDRTLKKEMKDINEERFRMLQQERETETKMGANGNMYDPTVIKDQGFQQYTTQENPSNDSRQPPKMPSMSPARETYQSPPSQRKMMPHVPTMRPDMPTMKPDRYMYQNDVSQRQFMPPPVMNQFAGMDEMARTSTDTRSSANLQRHGRGF
jgi:hypothetical protein